MVILLLPLRYSSSLGSGILRLWTLLTPRSLFWIYKYIWEFPSTFEFLDLRTLFMIYDYLTMFIFMDADVTGRTGTWSTMISARYSEKNCFPLQLPSAGNASVWGPGFSLAQLSFLNEPPCLMSKSLAQLVFYSFVLNVGTWFRLSNNLSVETFFSCTANYSLPMSMLLGSSK